MARFCTECGEALTKPMTRCPRCGSAVVSPMGEESSLILKATILLAVVIILSTIFTWYSLHINIDGGGTMDAAANLITRILPGYSGISTTYGLITFALALVIIVASVCRRRVVILGAAIGCVITAIVAMSATPDFLALNAVTEGEGVSLTETLNSPLGQAMMGQSSALQEVAMAIEVGASFVVVDISYGLYMMLIASIATVVIALYDIILALRTTKSNKIEA
ncbi:MAG: zinc ribbon domain-containing protein [Alistipes sp.]|nr:zinc ribbon domain-containing protein [Alistipes sp.]